MTKQARGDWLCMCVQVRGDGALINCMETYLATHNATLAVLVMPMPPAGHALPSAGHALCLLKVDIQVVTRKSGESA